MRMLFSFKVFALSLLMLLTGAVFCFAAPKNDAAKEAKKLEKQGWKAMDGTIEQQLSRSFQLQQVYASNGSPRYVMATAESKGKTLPEAKMASENTAKMMLAASLSSSIQAEVTTITSSTGVDSLQTETREHASSRSESAFDAGSCSTVICIYKKESDGYQVQTTLAYDTQKIHYQQ